MDYTTLDYLPDLTISERNQARTLIFSPYVPSTSGITWNEVARAYGNESYAILHSLYAFTAKEGEVYDIFSTSYFDPYVVLVYDAAGNAIAANNENDDPADMLLPDGGYYSSDVIFNWTAPYTGTFYVNASWDQGSYFKFYDLAIYGDTRTASTGSSSGTDGPDNIVGTASADSIVSGAGNDTVAAGDGADTITDTSGSNYIRGGFGNDLIFGGAGYDDVNGNQGEDTIDGGAGGNDWLLGGQGNDQITSTAGNVILNGNLGNDTVTAGSGNDFVRGGQGDDVVRGGAGDDHLYPDRGNDTVTGGSGADVFHFSVGGGADRITDFNGAEGDRILLDFGVTYTLAQSGADTVLTLSSGDTIILAGVTRTSIAADWIV